MAENIGYIKYIVFVLEFYFEYIKEVEVGRGCLVLKFFKLHFFIFIG